jgi:uncharacterized protein (UPF0264 family)
MKLLVSVRSTQEAVAAMEGSADVIDVKEPLRGALGRADDCIVEEIAKIVRPRKLLSAAMGELKHWHNSFPSDRLLSYMKWGLSECEGGGWREMLLTLRRSTSSTVVPAAYADAHLAGSPAIEEVADFVIEERFPLMLIDTWTKNAGDLFSWLKPDSLMDLCKRLKLEGVKLAIAGSLTLERLQFIRMMDVDVVGVRGAVCTANDRTGQVDACRVKEFKAALDSIEPETWMT